MSRLMYDPTQDSKFSYNLPIMQNDVMCQGFTYRELIDTCIANKGHDLDEERLKDAIMEILDEIQLGLWENFELCKENILAEINER